jgi:Mg-chelatase subunit ChlD
MKKYSGIEFRGAVEEILGKINNALGLKPIQVKWAADISTAAINMNGTVLMADIPDSARVDHATLVKYCGMGAHELCHHAYTEWYAVHEANQGGSLLRHLHNAVEDAFIERKAIRAGLTGNIEHLFKSLINGMVTEALSEATDWSNPAQYPFALAIYLRDHATTKVPLAQGLEPIFAEAKKMFSTCDSSIDALQIARWIAAQMKGLPRQESSQPGGEQQAKGKGQPGEGQEGPQKGSGDASEGEGEGDPQPGPAKAPTGREDFRPVEPAVEAPDAGGAGGDGGSYCEGADLAKPGAHLKPGVNHAVSIAVPAALRYNLKRLFDNSAQTEFGLRRKAGSVDVNSLSRLGVSDKLFKRRSETDGIDSAVVILLDVSGSMFRRRLQPALECCAALLDALDRAQVATALFTFNGDTSVVKQWSDSKFKALASLTKVHAEGGTNDYFAVRYAHKMLALRPEERKVCIVLSDGCGHVVETARQVKDGESLGITTIGIGIQSDVSRVYPQSVMVDSLSDLGSASFKQIKLAV